MVFLWVILIQAMPEGAWVTNIDNLEEVPDWVGHPMVGPNEHVYFIDPRGSRVYHLDAKGAFLRTYGRQGQGPGEFQHPQYFSVSAVSGKILVGDTNRNTLWAFSSEGKFLGAHFENQGSEAFAIGDETILSLEEKDPFVEPNQGCSLVVRKRGESEGTHVKHYSSAQHQDWLTIEYQGSRAVFRETWIRRVLVAVSPDQAMFYVGSNDKIAFDRYLAADLSLAGRVEDATVPNLPLEDEEIASDRSSFRVGSKKFTLADFDHPATKPAVSAIFCDSAQRLWVQLMPRHNQREQHFRIFNPEGTLAGTFVMKYGSVFHADRKFIWITTANREGDQLIVKTPYSLEPVP